MRWFTSDLHLGHTNIIKYTNRPYHTAEEMNEALVDNWNSAVSADDTVWVLGDVALGPIKESLALIGLLNGHKILLPGNHDRVWKGLAPKRRWDDQTYLDAGFERIEHGDIGVYPLTLGQDIGQPQHGVLLSHFPYTIGQYDNRFSAWHPIDYGVPLLHGHTHSPIRTAGNMIHIGTDAWDYTPVSEATIIEMILAGGVGADHEHEQ